MLNSLKGKTALISGAAQGIGRAIARSYHAAGAHLILLDQSLDSVKTLKEESWDIKVNSEVLYHSLKYEYGFKDT